MIAANLRNSEETLSQSTSATGAGRTVSIRSNSSLLVWAYNRRIVNTLNHPYGIRVVKSWYG